MQLTNIDLDALRTLVLAKDLGGFGRAAEQLRRTPSAISLQMKRLQEEVGVPLLRRQGRKTELTEQGEIAVRYARRVLDLNDEMLDTLPNTVAHFPPALLTISICGLNAPLPHEASEFPHSRGPNSALEHIAQDKRDRYCQPQAQGSLTVVKTWFISYSDPLN